MQLTCPSFKNSHVIPDKYSRYYQDFSPPLAWIDVPPGTVSYTLFCDDPDAPNGNWVHWVFFNIPASQNNLPENVDKKPHPAIGGVQGRNDFGQIGYGGPIPPKGTHTYIFTLLALDTEIACNPGVTKKEVIRQVSSHILAKAQLIGTYSH